MISEKIRGVALATQCADFLFYILFFCSLLSNRLARVCVCAFAFYLLRSARVRHFECSLE